MSCEVFKEKCQGLYQSILSAVENDAKLRPYSTDLSNILTCSISNFEKELTEAMKLHTRSEMVTVMKPEVQFNVNGDIQSNEEHYNSNNIIIPNGLSNGEKSTSEPIEQTECEEFDEAVQNAVSNLFSRSVNGKDQVESSHDADCHSEYSVIEIDDEDEENALNCDTTAKQDGPFIGSEVVTHHHQCTQQLMFQAIDGCLMGIREEVVTTTTTTTESRSEQNEPAKRKVGEDLEEQPSSKRRFSVDRSVQTDLKSKPISKRRCSLAERKFYDDREKEQPSENQKSRYDSRMAQSKSESKQRSEHRRFSMHERASHSAYDHSFAKSPQLKPQTSKYQEAMKKRRSNLRRTVSSRRDLQDHEEAETTPKLKNTDKNMHCRNDLYRTLCVLCDGKSQWMVQHYKKEHPDSEVFISRPSPQMAERMRLQNDNFKVIKNKITGFCYFCEEEKTMTRRDYMEHILRHTGELLYTCNRCQFNGKRLIDHTNCRGGPVSIYDLNATDGTLAGFICNICNYVQIGRERMHTHLRKEHGYNVLDALNGRHYKKVMLAASPYPNQSKIVTEFVMVKPPIRYKCTICSKKCNGDNEFEKHFDESHSDAVEYVCFCGEVIELDSESFSSGNYIASVHLCRHNEELYQCKSVTDGMVCDEIFDDLKNVYDHLLNDHRESEFRYQHVKRATDIPTIVTEITFRKLQCNICKFDLKTKTFDSALKHFAKYHRVGDDDHDVVVENIAHLYKKVSYLAKKSIAIKTEYCGGGEVLLSI